MSQIPHHGTIHLDNPSQGYTVTLNMDKFQTGRDRSDTAVLIAKDLFEALDLAGMMFASADDHCSHSLNMEASWCQLHIEQDASGDETAIRIRSKLEDYEGDKAAQLKDLNATLGMLNAMTIILGPAIMAIAELSANADKTTNAEHSLRKMEDGPV